MGHKQELGAAEKMELIQDYLSGKISLNEAARRAGAANASVKQWVDNYETEGVKAFTQHKQWVYSPGLKLQAVQDYLSGKGSQSDISKKYGLRDRKQLRDWIKAYNAHGDFNSVKHSEGGSCMKQGRDTTQEERIQIVKDCLASGKNYGQMALKYKVSSTSRCAHGHCGLRRWAKPGWKTDAANERKAGYLAPSKRRRKSR